jgi:hypothetical protein
MFGHLLLVIAVAAVCAWLLALYVSHVLAGILVILVVAYVIGLLIDSRHPRP